MIRSTIIRRAFLLVLVTLFASATYGQQTPEQALHELLRPELHVLFIGNSFIYFNNMPRLVEAISESVDGPRIRTEMVAIGGARLEDLWKEGSAIAAIRKRHWDFIVLNEQSALGGGIVNGERRIGDPANFFKYAEMFDTETRKSGARTVILMTWKDKNDPQQIQTQLNSAFLEFRKKMSGGVVLCFVSDAWWAAIRSVPEANLYFDDNHHPSKEGSYLVACTVYSTLTKIPPKGAPTLIEGTPVEEETGTVQAGKTKTLVNISPRVATKLQEIAWRVGGMLEQFGYQ